MLGDKLESSEFKKKVSESEEEVSVNLKVEGSKEFEGFEEGVYITIGEEKEDSSGVKEWCKYEEGYESSVEQEEMLVGSNLLRIHLVEELEEKLNRIEKG